MKSTKQKRPTVILAIGLVLSGVVLPGLTITKAGYAKGRSNLPIMVTPRALPMATRAESGNSISITPTPDTDRTVSAEMSTEGGTLVASGADGTVFTLTIPAEALPDDEQITMTPVSAIDDLPFSGGPAAAVELGPEGLLLVAPATLVISPPAAVPIDQQSPFGWYRAGEDFHLYPLTLDVNTLTFAVTHFNGYGIGKGTSGDRQAVEAHQPGRSNAQINQLIETFSEAARSKLATIPPAIESFKEQGKGKPAKIIKVFKSEEEQVLIQAVHNLIEMINSHIAAGNEASLRCDLLEAVRTVNLIHEGSVDMQGKYPLDLTILTDEAAAFEQALAQALQTLAKSSNQRCGQGEVQEIATLLGLAKFANKLAGLDKALAPLTAVATTINNLATSCASLQMRFDSTVTLTFPQSPLQINIPMSVSPEQSIAGINLMPQKDASGNFNGVFTGSGQLRHKEITTSLVDCGITGQAKTDSVLNIVSLEFDIKLRDVECPGEDATPIGDIKAVIDVGRPSEMLTVTCPPPSQPFSTSGEVWRGHFYCGHQKESVGGSGSRFTIKGWDVGSGGTVASKTYNLTPPAPCFGFTEQTFIKVEKAL